MKNLNKKPKKLTIKYYLRKDIPPFVYTQNGYEETYYPLYIEFIYNRKVNKCKSRCFQFVPGESYMNSFIGGFENSSTHGYNIYGIKESVFTEDVKEMVNNDIETDFQQITSDHFLQLLLIEKQHLKYLFQMLFEQIDDENFVLSKVSTGYQNSLKFMFDYFDDVIKEQIQKKVNEILPFFPLFDKSENCTLLVQKLGKTFSYLNRSEADLQNAQIGYLERYIMLMNIFQLSCRRYFVSDIRKHIHCKGMTLPIWIVENHSDKLKRFVNKTISKIDNENHLNIKMDPVFDLLLNQVNNRVQNDLSIILESFK